MFVSPACYTHHYRTRSGHKTTINKTIVYADTVLNLKDLGSNLKVTTIDKVSKFSLETCLQYIFEANPDVTFNTVQYSQQNETVYFYTDKPISTLSWYERNCLKCIPLATSNAIVQEITKIISWLKITDRDVISLDHINKLIRERKSKYKEVEETIEFKLRSALIHQMSDDISFCLHKFDFKELILSFSFKRYKWLSWDDFEIKKTNTGDFYISKATGLYKDEIWYAICPILSEIYDDFLQFKSLFKEHKYGTSSINSNFTIDISGYGVDVNAKDFILTFNTYSKDYEVKCNSSIVITQIKGNEQTLFENIYVKIDKCPKWMQEELYSIRQNELQPKKDKTQESIKPKKNFIKRFFSLIFKGDF